MGALSSGTACAGTVAQHCAALQAAAPQARQCALPGPCAAHARLRYIKVVWCRWWRWVPGLGGDGCAGARRIGDGGAHGRGGSRRWGEAPGTHPP